MPSRRERPAKPALTRQGIVDAALAVLRAEGLAKVTMRRVAAAVDSGHASLYVYVRDTEDLHAQVLDRLLGELCAPSSGSWRDRLKALLTGYRDLLTRHQGIARMAISTQPSGPNYRALVESVLALLHEGGVPDGAAAWGVDLLLLYPTATAVEHTDRRVSDRKERVLADLAGELPDTDPSRFPHTARLGTALFSGDPAGRTDWALDVLIDGLLSGKEPIA